MTRAADVPDISAIEAKLVKLQAALSRDLPRERRLRRWSEFIRERDGHRCVDCHSRRRLSAHHICRKSFLAEPQFETGNGITLCSTCHREAHRGFNARPDLSLPVDAQGGEKLAAMERL
jgi:5-methylcytosine-specific restriction endonuclease McrA